MNYFDTKSPEEKCVLTLDFSKDLAANETLTGIPTIQFSVWAGMDASPGSIANGTAAIDVTGVLVLIPVQGGNDVTDYRVKGVCATSNPQKVLMLEGILPVRA